jgi:FkbM family methyltransferase
MAMRLSRGAGAIPVVALKQKAAAPRARLTFRRVLAGLAARATANDFSQRILDRTVGCAQYLQGIGSGGELLSSGEGAVLLRMGDMPARGRSIQIFDVGANTGKFVEMARAILLATGCHIHCFEPSGETFAKLCEQWRGHDDVTLNAFGLGEEPGRATLYSDSAQSGLASLTKRRLTHFGIDMDLTETVRIDTLDCYCERNHVGYIDLLKLDVEGHELAVLRGGARMFANSAIGAVTFEFGGCDIDTRTFLQDFFYFFSDHKMTIARITPSGYFRTITSYREMDEQFRTANFVCRKI